MTSSNKELIILAAVALGSMAVGFVVVLLVLGPGEGTTLPDPFTEGAGARGAPSGSEGDHASVSEGSRHIPRPASPAPVGEGNAVTPEVDPASTEAPASTPPPPPEPPPVATKEPSGQIQLGVGEPFVWRCWPAGSDTHLEKQACGALDGIEKIVTDNLGTIESCVVEHAGKDASGKLSLAVKLDFDDGSVNAWLGNSTTVAGLEAVSACLRTGFSGLSPPPVDHTHPRYIVFFNVQVG